MRISDWSSDVCSSDLGPPGYRPRHQHSLGDRERELHRLRWRVAEGDCRKPLGTAPQGQPSVLCGQAIADARRAGPGNRPDGDADPTVPAEESIYRTSTSIG